MASRMGRGLTSSADSSPRTQRGMITGSLWTFSNPSRRISATIQSIARSRLGEPLMRWPKPSTSCARRLYAKLSRSAA